MILVPPALGYYITRSEKAAYDPGLEVPCPYCIEPITEDNVRSFNLMQMEKQPYLSVFYRTHKTCHEEASAVGKQNLDDVVMATLEAIANQKGETNG